MVHSDMLCFVQSITSSKKKDKSDATIENNTEESSSKSAKKNFIRLSLRLKKKSPSSCASSVQDDRTESSPENSPESHHETMNHQEVLQQHAAAAAAAEEILTNTPGSSKARQKKFHRYFKEVPSDEKVINYYSCALVGDVTTVHGNLYITKNYFAFYSNIFGNENKLLIPTSTILSITKEKAALSKPNAVAVTSVKEKYLFGLFISRDSSYKLMIQVWNAAMNPLPSQYLVVPSKDTVKEIIQGSSDQCQNTNEDDSSLSGSDINISPDLLHSTSVKYKPIENTDISTMSTSKMSSSRVDGCCQTSVSPWTFVSNASKTNLVLTISTVLLTFLFLSAGILLYRISCLQQSYSQDNYITTARSMKELQEFFSSNLHHISKIRKSLEALSLLIDQENLSNNVMQSNHDFDTSAPLTETS